mmetsp:Transcript_32673/g.68127  ORF Transcript_32673/g.68127 Transcript_32673/m.68127 type:complete len:135 (+) Transcript_32673:4369-4773(+)
MTDPTAQGKIVFAMVVKYKRGRSTPDGNFIVKATDPRVSFHGKTFDWLVVTGNCAKFQGIGRLLKQNRDFGFLATVCDHGEPGSSDTIRVKFWDKNRGTIVYDNGMGASAASYDGTVIDRGNIQIHRYGNHLRA